VSKDETHEKVERGGEGQAPGDAAGGDRWRAADLRHQVRRTQAKIFADFATLANVDLRRARRR
jgi:hypothetical protein